MHVPIRKLDRTVWRDGFVGADARQVAEETAIALTYNGGTYLVMMATPQDLQDFAIGFSLNEGIVQSADEIGSVEVVELDDGIELRMWLASERATRISQRRRHIAGPTGCGICGLESIAEAVRPAAIVPRGSSFTPREIMTAMAVMAPLQALNIETRSVHAAAYWTPLHGVVALREDVGRHNALDKLAGAIAQHNVAIDDGIVLLTSRVSVEMVQKSAAMGASMVVAVSAPTALAVRMADAAGITLCAIARADGFEVFTHPHRVAIEVAVEESDRVVA